MGAGNNFDKPRLLDNTVLRSNLGKVGIDNTIVISDEMTVLLKDSYHETVCKRVGAMISVHAFTCLFLHYTVFWTIGARLLTDPGFIMAQTQYNSTDVNQVCEDANLSKIYDASYLIMFTELFRNYCVGYSSCSHLVFQHYKWTSLLCGCSATTTLKFT